MCRQAAYEALNEELEHEHEQEQEQEQESTATKTDQSGAGIDLDLDLHLDLDLSRDGDDAGWRAADAHPVGDGGGGGGASTSPVSMKHFERALKEIRARTADSLLAYYEEFARRHCSLV